MVISEYGVRKQIALSHSIQSAFFSIIEHLPSKMEMKYIEIRDINANKFPCS